MTQTLGAALANKPEGFQLDVAMQQANINLFAMAYLAGRLSIDELATVYGVTPDDITTWLAGQIDYAVTMALAYQAEGTSIKIENDELMREWGYQ